VNLQSSKCLRDVTIRPVCVSLTDLLKALTMHVITQVKTVIRNPPVKLNNYYKFREFFKSLILFYCALH
jgi:hypothetical protein